MAYLNLKKYRRAFLSACGLLGALLLPTIAWAQVAERLAPPVVVTVNSPADGPLLADGNLTLREAIEIVNGTLLLSNLSRAEQQQVRPGGSGSEILFDLPVGQTAIELISVLPAIARPNTRIDATTQPGYDASTSATVEIDIPVPAVVLRPKADREIFRGLTLSADGISVRGLSIYGFNAPSRITQSTPPADIFISHRPIPQNRETPLPATGDDTNNKGRAPSNIIIEYNWLGLPPERQYARPEFWFWRLCIRQ